jgi:hypothetical protein
MRNLRLVTGCLLALLPIPALYAQGTSTGFVGWYNGDWQQGIPGQSNWYVSPQSFARTYDNFVVPDGGWTVTGVFSNNTMAGTGVTQASWEIRSGVAAGQGGTVVASGLSAATQTFEATNGSNEYLIRVDGLWITLPAGQYWLSVSPVFQGNSYNCFTLGGNAAGSPAGKDGHAFSYSSGGSNFTSLNSTGGGGTSSDLSMGVVITAPALPRLLEWPANLISLAQQMETNHSLPYPGVSMDDFYASLADLYQNVPLLTDAEIRTRLQAIVASIGDPHTDIGWGSPQPYRTLPLKFYLFDDGMYITDAPSQYQDLLGGKLVSINDTGVDDVVQRLTPLIAHDNDSWLKATLTAARITNTYYLFGTGIIDSTDSAQITVQKASGDLVSLRVQAVNQTPRMTNAYQGPLPLSRQHPDQYYWSTVIDGGATVYFQYNSCTEDPRGPSADFLAQLDQTLAQPGVQRLVVDMRNNTGGSAAILDPWIQKIAAGRFNAKGRLYVIVGRATFSAAMEATDMFHDQTQAIFVGEDTGGKPQFLLRRGDFGLPYFGIRVSFSNGYEHAKDPGPTLVPDIPTPVTFQNYSNGVDPALDAILSIAPPG